MVYIVSLADIQHDIGDPNGQLGAFAVSDHLDRAQRSTRLLLAELSFQLPSLETRLRLGHTILHGFHAVAADERPPRSHAVGFQYDIRVYQYGAAMPNHDAS